MTVILFKRLAGLQFCQVICCILVATGYLPSMRRKNMNTTWERLLILLAKGMVVITNGKQLSYKYSTETRYSPLLSSCLLAFRDLRSASNSSMSLFLSRNSLSLFSKRCCSWIDAVDSATILQLSSSSSPSPFLLKQINVWSQTAYGSLFYPVRHDAGSNGSGSVFKGRCSRPVFPISILFSQMVFLRWHFYFHRA